MNHNRNWTIRPYRIGDEKNIFSLWDTVHPERKLARDTWEAWWNWMYNQVPHGNRIWLAEDNGKIVGQYCCILVEFKYGDKTVMGTHSLDTLTHPDYRRQGIMLTLSKKVFEELAKENIVIIYGFPNELAYKNDIRLGFSRVAVMKKRKRVFHWKNSINSKVDSNLLIKLGSVIGKAYTSIFFRVPEPPVLKGLTISQISSFDEGFNEFWQRISCQFPIMVVKNQDYLNWRFTKVPGIDYIILKAEKNNLPEGYIVYRHVKRRKAIGAMIYDLIANSQETAENLIAEAVKKCHRGKVDYMFWLGTHQKMYLKAFRKQGFFHQPFDQERNCVAIPNDISISPNFLSDPGNWAVQLTDSDEL